MHSCLTFSHSATIEFVRYLLLSDIHANSPALEAVLWDAFGRNVDRVISLGDALGYGPFPAEVLSRLRSIEAECILGNHDTALLGLLGGRRTFNMRESIVRTLIWQLEQLGDEDLSWVARWPAQREYRTGRHSAFLCSHGSPRNGVTYVDTLAIAREEFSLWNGQLCFVGHTHLPVVYSSTQAPTGEWVGMTELEGAEVSLDLKVEQRWIVNPGSVGQPRDGDPRAAYGLYDDETCIFEVHRVDYDLEETAQAIRKAGLDELSALRLTIGQ